MTACLFQQFGGPGAPPDLGTASALGVRHPPLLVRFRLVLRFDLVARDTWRRRKLPLLAQGGGLRQLFPLLPSGGSRTRATINSASAAGPTIRCAWHCGLGSNVAVITLSYRRRTLELLYFTWDALKSLLGDRLAGLFRLTWEPLSPGDLGRGPGAEFSLRGPELARAISTSRR